MVLISIIFFCAEKIHTFGANDLPFSLTKHLLREALLTFVGAAKLMFPVSVPFGSVRKIIDFYREYMNPRHVLLSTETLKT